MGYDACMQPRRHAMLFLSLLLPGMLYSVMGYGRTACADYVPDDTPDVATLLNHPGDHKGLLWRIEGKGRRASHILGTIHLDNRRVTAVPPSVRLTLVRSRKLMIEVLLDNRANLAYQQAIYYPRKTGQPAPLPELLGRDYYPRFQHLAVDIYGLTAGGAAYLKPWAAFSLLARPRPRSGAVLDEVLSRLAAQAGRPVVGIEKMDELLAALEAIPLDDQLEILRDTLCNHQLLMQQVKILLRIYLARDLDALERFNHQPHHDEAVFERFQQRILYRRNEIMLQRILPEIDEGGVFIAVGALHLTGPRGLLQSLRDAGYRITVAY